MSTAIIARIFISLTLIQLEIIEYQFSSIVFSLDYKHFLLICYLVSAALNFSMKGLTMEHFKNTKR